MIMVHGDNQGLVLPPRVAPKQVVIIWIYKAADSEDEINAMRLRANEIGDLRLTNRVTMMIKSSNNGGTMLPAVLAAIVSQG